MTADIVAATLAGLGPMIQSSARKPLDKYASRRRYGDLLLMQGAQYKPLQGGVVEGLARAGQAVLGGWLANRADEQQTAEEDTQRQGIMDAIAKAQASGDFSPVAQALAKAGQVGPAASLVFADMAQRRQQGLARSTADSLFPPTPGGGMPPGGAPTGDSGQPKDYYSGVAFEESGNNPQARHPLGGAGLYGFMPQTWAGARAAIPGLPDHPTQATPEQQNAAAQWMTQQNAAVLTRALGRPPSGGELRLAHFFGGAGASRLLTLDPNTPFERVPDGVLGMPTATVVAANPQLRGMTVGSLLQGYRQRYDQFNPVGGQPQTQGGQPPAPTVVAGPPMAPPQGGAPDVTSTQFGQVTSPPPMVGQPPAQPPMAPPQAPGMPAPPEVPRPQLPPEQAARLRGLVASGAMTAQQAMAEAQRITDGMWSAERERARLQYGADLERWKSDRDANAVKIKDVDGLRKEIMKLPQVDALVTVVPIFNSMQEAAKRNSRAADLDLIYGLGKILDPGSVVREGEMVLVQKTGGIFDQMKGWVSGMQGGAALPPDVRAEILAIANGRVRELKQSADDAVTPYRGIIQRRGWTEADVMPGLPQIKPYDPTGISQTPRQTVPPAGRAPASGGPPQNHIDALKANPGLRDQFDAKYGQGAADRYLKGGR